MNYVELDMYTDGCAKGNPGPGGAGIFITEVGNKNKVVVKKSLYLGEEVTNNIAEYKALIYGLKICIRIGVKKINIYLDSELVVNQITGKFQVRNQELAKLYLIVMTLLKKIKSYKIEHVPREKNSEADLLANQGLLNPKEIDEEDV